MRNKEYKFNRHFLKKYVPLLFCINAIFIWSIVVAFMYEYINNFVGFILGAVSIVVEYYAHGIACDYLEKKYQLDEEDEE